MYKLEVRPCRDAFVEGGAPNARRDASLGSFTESERQLKEHRFLICAVLACCFSLSSWVRARARDTNVVIGDSPPCTTKNQG